MVFETITDGEIAVGEPTTRPLFQKVKNSLDDLDDRVSSTEVGASSRPDIEFGIAGLLPEAYAADGVMLTRVSLDIALLACRVLVNVAGSSGTLTIDVEYKRGGGAWTSILSAPISVDSADGDLAIESGTLVVTDLLTGDLLRLNVDGVQVDMSGFVVLIENEVA